MKVKMEVQYNNKNTVTSDIEKQVKEDLKAQGIKMNAIKTLDIYFQPASTTVYYLATLTDGSEVKSDALIVE